LTIRRLHFATGHIEIGFFPSDFSHGEKEDLVAGWIPVVTLCGETFHAL